MTLRILTIERQKAPLMHGDRTKYNFKLTKGISE